MSLIKSALEIALEKSQDLKIDKEELRRKDLYKSARTLGGQALTESEGSEKLKSTLKEKKASLSKEDYQLLKEGVLESLLNPVSLSMNAEDPTELDRLFASLAHLCSGNNSVLRSSLEQVLKQFQAELLQLRDAIESQLGPKLRQRAEQLAMQTGQRVNYAPERDPDFIRIYNQHVEQLKEHYQQSLDQIKSQIKDSL